MVEAFSGEQFSGPLGANPIPDAAILLESAWHDLFELVYANLLSQTHLADLCSRVLCSWSDQDQSVQADISAVAQELKSRVAAKREEGLWILGEFAKTLRGFQA